MARLTKVYLGTNTKMNKTIRETQAFLQALDAATADLDRAALELFVIPAYTALYHARSAAPRERIKIGAQNMCWEEQGQYTGEISPLMLAEIGIDVVMIGHSERRHIFDETDARENWKVLAALRHGFTALLCIGETLAQKESGIADETLRTQLILGLQNVTADMAQKLWIAYEPVWAIGENGTPASEAYADAKHAVIKQCLRELFGAAGLDIPVLYGGSVKPENAVALISQTNIDGLFIGRSAWEAARFNQLIRTVVPAFKLKRSRMEP